MLEQLLTAPVHVMLAGATVVVVLFLVLHRRASAGSLRSQLVLSFASVAAVSLVVIVGAVIVHTRSILAVQTGRSFQILAESNSRLLAQELAREVEVLQNLADDVRLAEYVARAPGNDLHWMQPQERKAFLLSREEAWTDRTSEAFLDAVLHNSASDVMDGFATALPEHVQLTLSDGYGSLVAAGGILPTHYYYGDAVWWQAAWNDGSGATYVGGLDVIAGGQEMALSIAVPVYHSQTEGRPLGILHSRFILRDLETFARIPGPGETGTLIVVEGAGRILYSSEPGQIGHRLADDVHDGIRRTSPGFSVTSGRDEQDFILGYAPLIVPQGQAYLDALDWTLIVQQSRAEAMPTVNDLLQRAVVGGALALVLAVAVGWRIALRLSRPIEELMDTTASMADGHLDRHAQVSGPREMCALAGSVNRLSAQLRETLGGLRQRVADLETTEEALRASENRYRELYDEAPLGYHEVDRAGRIVRVNRTEAEFLGYTVEEMTCRPVWDFVTADQRDAVKETIRGRLAGRRPVVGFDSTVVCRDGREVRVHTEEKLIVDGDGQVTGIRSTLQDISARKRAEEALRQYVDRLRLLREIDQAILEARSPQEIAQASLCHIRRLVPCLGAGVAMFHHETREVTVFVADADEALGGRTEIRFPLDAFGDTSGILETLGRGEPFVMEDIAGFPEVPPEINVLQSRGERAVLIVPLLVGEELIAFLGLTAVSAAVFGEEQFEIAREVADQLAIAIQNAHLLESERKRRHVAEVLRQASAVLNSTLELDEVLDLILQQLRRVIPYDSASVHQMQGEHLEILACQGFAEPSRVVGLVFPLDPKFPNWRVVMEKTPLAIDDVPERYPHFKDEADTYESGSIRSWLGVPLMVQEQLIGMLALDRKMVRPYSAEDVELAAAFANQAAIAIHNARLHRQVRAHANDLADALARQAELDRLKGEFIQNVSHELRSPLALIRGYAELLDGGDLGKLQPDQQQATAIISRRSRMLSDLVQDITLILQAEARPLAKDLVAVDEVARVAVEDFRMAAAQARLRLEADVADDVAPVKGSLAYLRRIVDNLLSNAIKFTPPGGTVGVRVWQEERHALLQVRDTGIGIPSDQTDRIFERFYQVDGSARRRYGGVGLGLALVKDLVELHGGRVTVASERGQGSVFTVYLPTV